MIRLTYTQYSQYFVCHIDNINELDVPTLQSLEQFAHDRSGSLDYQKESFRIPKRIELPHLQELFKLKGLDVFITQQAPLQHKPLNTATINFGKFKGTKWIDLEQDYLVWLSQNLQGDDKQTAINELERRVQSPKSKQIPQPECLSERIGFGKYKGKAWEDLPDDYLQWVAGNLQGRAAQNAQMILQFRHQNS